MEGNKSVGGVGDEDHLDFAFPASSTAGSVFTFIA